MKKVYESTFDEAVYASMWLQEVAGVLRRQMLYGLLFGLPFTFAVMCLVIPAEDDGRFVVATITAAIYALMLFTMQKCFHRIHVRSVLGGGAQRNRFRRKSS